MERCVAAYATRTATYLLCYTDDYRWGYALDVEHIGGHARSVRHPAEFADRLELEELSLLTGDLYAAAELRKRLAQLG